MTWGSRHLFTSNKCGAFWLDRGEDGTFNACNYALHTVQWKHLHIVAATCCARNYPMINYLLCALNPCGFMHIEKAFCSIFLYFFLQAILCSYLLAYEGINCYCQVYSKFDALQMWRACLTAKCYATQKCGMVFVSRLLHGEAWCCDTTCVTGCN